MEVVVPVALVLMVLTALLFFLRSFAIVRYAVMVVALLGLLGGGALAMSGLGGRDLGSGLAVILGGTVAVASLCLLVLAGIVQFVNRSQKPSTGEG
jgi:hypothetical protein